MTAILTNNFRLYNLKHFLNSISSNKLYTFISKDTAWDSENNPPSPIDNERYISDVYDEVISLKKLLTTNFIPVVNKVVWTSNVTYDMYRPDYTSGNGETSKYPLKLTANASNSLAYGSTFYVMNEFYQVYKCLYNGQTPETPNGVSSTVQPVGVSATPFITNDGYRWKYLYTIPSFYVLNFINDSYIPVPYSSLGFNKESLVTNSAVNGGIDTVVVLSSGSGYASGTYTSVPIVGDGTGATCTVIVTSGAISKVTVTNSGQNYTFASINLNGIISHPTGANANLEVIIPPYRGHGYEPVDELFSYKLMIHVNFDYNETGFIPDISYRRIGIVANPYVWATQSILNSSTATGLYSITFTSATGNYSYGESITQQSTGAIGRVVSWDSGTKTLKYSQDRFSSTTNGILNLFSGTGAIVGQTSTVSGVPSTYANPDIQPNSGQILYMGNRKAIVRSSNQIEDVKVVVEF